MAKPRRQLPGTAGRRPRQLPGGLDASSWWQAGRRQQLVAGASSWWQAHCPRGWQAARRERLHPVSAIFYKNLEKSVIF